MNILVIGSGGREHALCWAIKNSANCNELFCSPGNAGIADVAKCINLEDWETTASFCKTSDIELVVVGPEAPLVDGITDYLEAKGITVLGPNKAAARLEASKDFTKELCFKYNIPAAASEKFTSSQAAKKYVEKQGVPIVIKADGLAAGKGVTVALTKEEAFKAIEDCLDSGKFGESGNLIIVEEFLEGEEASFFALCDGKNYIDFGTACDHKRAFDGDKGPNTGGMGTFSPANIIDGATYAKIKTDIIEPSLKALEQEGCPFKGFLFAGIMLTKAGPKLIEYNVRMGDPETQTIMPRIKTDIVELLHAAATENLEGKTVEFNEQSSVCIIYASNGYPEAYEKNTPINFNEEFEDVINFHAGTAIKDGQLVATGGRVLGLVSMAESLDKARIKAYKEIEKIDWPKGFYRTDIGKRGL